MKDEPLPLGFPRIEKTEGSRPWCCRADRLDCSRAQPCVNCRNRQNVMRGRRKQRAGRKGIERVTGMPAARFVGALANEETWRLPIRAEVKSGRQVQTIWTKYLAAEAQAEVARAVGDTRPFLMVAMPPQTTDGLVLFRLSDLARVAEALTED